MKRTHFGKFLGVPVYFDFTDEECPILEGKFTGCDTALNIMEPMFGIFCYIMSAMTNDFEPLFPMKVAGEIDPENGKEKKYG